MESFTIATLNTDAGPRAAIGVGAKFYTVNDVLNEADNEELSAHLDGQTVLGLLQHWDATESLLGSIAADIHGGSLRPVATDIADAPLLTPVRYPNKLLAVGANYSGHLREMGLEVSKWTPMPLFVRPPTTTLVGPGTTVRIPASTKQFDWECELAVVLGAPLRNASRAEAAKAIAGYSIGLDLTCRDLLAVNNDLHVDLVRGKAQDTMAPCGPTIMPARFVTDVDDLRIQLSVNDEPMMDASTSEMLFKIDEQLSLISEVMTLEPGDILFTGSPAGSAGEHGGRWLQPGDHIHAEITGLDALDVTMLPTR